MYNTGWYGKQAQAQVPKSTAYMCMVSIWSHIAGLQITSRPFSFYMPENYPSGRFWAQLPTTESRMDKPEFCMKFYQKIIYIWYFSLLLYVYGYFPNTVWVFLYWWWTRKKSKTAKSLLIISMGYSRKMQKSDFLQDCHNWCTCKKSKRHNYLKKLNISDKSSCQKVDAVLGIIL